MKINKYLGLFVVVALGMVAAYLKFGGQKKSPVRGDEISRKSLELNKAPAKITEQSVDENDVRPVIVGDKDSHQKACGCATCQSGDEKKADTAVRTVVMDRKFRQGVFSRQQQGRISFPLPGGAKASGRVQQSRVEAGELVMVQGRLESPHPGFFFFQKQSLPGVAGEMVGVVRFDKGDVAYRVEPGEDGKPVLAEHRADDVFCRNYAPVPEQGAEEIPADHPDNVGIPAYQNGVIPLQSLPGATGVVYLDFDGEEGPHNGWGDFDAAPANANNAQIKHVWERVAEDFAPFNLNVTTDLQVYLDAPENSRIRCIVTPTTNAAPGAGGVAYVGSYNWTGDTPCWGFYSTGKSAAEVISHEIGHTLGLSHDGRTTPSEGYYGGHGSGEVGWAPIMGVGYYKNLSQWSKGEYLNANQAQDDLAIITGNNNNVDYRQDDHGDSLVTASYLEVLADDSVSNQGVIETGGDLDGFRFETSGGNVSLTVGAVSAGPNVDLLAEIVDSSGSVVVSDNPDTLVGATVSANLAAGEYFLRVSGVGRGDVLGDGYTDYGSLGYYTVSGNVAGAVKPDRFSIAENSANGTPVGTVTPRNNHGGAALGYAIASGNSSGAFSIDGSSGALSVADVNQLDYEVLSGGYDDPARFELFVDITNSSNTSLNETVRVVVTLTDVNEAHSIVGVSTAQVYQSATVGTEVATFRTQGEDRYESGMSWSITSGNTGNAFSMSSDGRLMVADSTALAAQGSYTLQIMATDNGPPAPVVSASHTVTVSTLLWNPGNALVLRNWTQEPGVTASQSTTGHGGDASRAIDGNTDGNWGNNSVTHTDNQQNSWWEVDLGADRSIGSVSLHNRTDCCSGRLSNFRVSILDASRTEVAGQDYYQGSGAVGASELWTLSSAVTGRYVRVQISGSNNDGNGVLSLAEVLVNEALPNNVALNTGIKNWTQESGVTASQSTLAAGGDAARAIDGNTNGNWSGNSVTHTDPSGNNSWWEVDLGADRAIDLINLHNRTDCCSGRLSNFRVSVLDAARTELSGQNFYQGSGAVGVSETWQLPARVVGRYVRVELLGQNNEGNGVLSLAEVEVFGSSDANGSSVSQSTTTSGGVASRAIDGNTDGNWANNSVTHTDSTSNNWWEVDLKGLHNLEQIVLYNRTDCCSDRLSNFRVSVWNGSTEVYGSNYFTVSGTHAKSVFSLSSLNGMIADRVRIELLGTNSKGDKVLSLAEVQVYGTEVVNQAPVASDSSFNIAEDATIGTSVGAVSASDPDAGDTLTYAITAGNTGGAFAIDSGTGAISIAASLDHETTASYSLTVTVTDNGSPSESDTATITVNVTDVNEAPSVSGTSGSVAENVSTGTSVVTVTATDPDTGDTLAYAITAGNTGGAFAIDNSGNITTATALDYETTASYTLTVTVTDSGSLTGTAAVTINITDMDESPGADNDGDGVSDVVENILGTDPNSASSTPGSHYTGLLGWWRLEETSGTVAADSSGYNHGGTISGTTSMNGVADNALNFNGSSDRINLGNPSALNFAGEITLSAWVRPEATNGFRNIMAHGYTFNPNAEVLLRIHNGVYQVGSWNGQNAVAAGGNANSDLNTWVHITGVYDGSHWRLYRNGVQIAVIASSQGALTVNDDWVIGSASNLSGRYFDGGVDDVRIYGRGLSAAEVSALYMETGTSGP